MPIIRDRSTYKKTPNHVLDDVMLALVPRGITIVNFCAIPEAGINDNTFVDLYCAKCVDGIRQLIEMNHPVLRRSMMLTDSNGKVNPQPLRALLAQVLVPGRKVVKDHEIVEALVKLTNLCEKESKVVDL